MKSPGGIAPGGKGGGLSVIKCPHTSTDRKPMFYVIVTIMGAFIFVLAAFCFMPIWLILGFLLFGSAKAGFIIYCAFFVMWLLTLPKM